MHKKFLSLFQKASIPFEEVAHRVVYTAYDTAQTLRLKLGEVAKPLLLKTEKGWFLAILSAGMSLDLKKVAKLAGVKKVRIPTEKEILSALKLKKKEGLSPFGSLYGVPVLLEKAFAKTGTAVFSVGSFTDSVKMKLKDFIKLESPAVGVFGVVKKFKKQKPPAKKKTSQKKRTKKTARPKKR